MQEPKTAVAMSKPEPILPCAAQWDSWERLWRRCWEGSGVVVVEGEVEEREKRDGGR